MKSRRREMPVPSEQGQRMQDAQVRLEGLLERIQPFLRRKVTRKRFKGSSWKAAKMK